MFSVPIHEVVSIDSAINSKCAFVRQNKKSGKTASWIFLTMEQIVAHHYTVTDL